MKNKNNRLNICKCPPSPRVLCRNYSEIKVINHQLHPYFIAGFSDGEACFSVMITKSKTYLIGWQVKPCFIIIISLHKKDQALLERIQSSLGGIGKIKKKGKDSIQFRVFSINELAILINHFDKYPLITQKYADFKMFKQVVELMANKEHLTPEGLKKIINIKASINKGLPVDLKVAFPDTKPVQRPVVELRSIPDPNWLAGFTSAEGSFMIKTSKSSTYKLGLQVQLKFQLTQHSTPSGE
jgi:hypothetical protein